MSELWYNRAPEISKRRIGSDTYRRLIDKADQDCAKIAKNGGGTREKIALLLSTGRVKKLVYESSALHRHHAVGAVGYAVVKPHLNGVLPENCFFEPERKFRVRFRHSNVNCNDDAMSCVREAAIKFSDQNCDGPLDLILLTGQRSQARNMKTLLKALRLPTSSDVQKLCDSDPYYFESLVDGLRRAPSSFTQLTYYSQITYQLTAKDGRRVAARFRLVPVTNDSGNGCDFLETGMLQAGEQEEPWNTRRRHGETRCEDYLAQEFMERLRRDEPVSYELQVQINHDVDETITWHPQKVWKEPWQGIVLIQLTTLMPGTALRRTYFNIVEKPRCLSFPLSTSPTDVHSLQYALSLIYCKYEDDHTSPIFDADDWRGSSMDASSAAPKRYIVTLVTAPLKNTGTVPPVDVFITLSGNDCRSTPAKLSSSVERKNAPWLQESSVPNKCTQHFLLEVEEDIGELLAVMISIRQQQLMDQWYLEKVYVVSLPDERTVHCFPCNSIVTARVTLRPGEACLAEKQKHELHRQERLFELCERKHQYKWLSVDDSSPAQLAAKCVKELPEMERLRAVKYTGLRWDVDPAIVEYFRYLVFDVIDGSKRQHLATVPQKSIGGKLFDAKSSSRVKANSSMQSRQRMMLRQYSVNVAAPVPTPIDVVKENVKPASAKASTSVETKSGSASKARAHWNLVKNAIKLNTGCNFKVILPEGAKGDMCRVVQNDVAFGRMFLSGPNPVMLQRCTRIPIETFPVTNDMVRLLLHRTKNLLQEARNGYVFLADYSLMHGIKALEKDADRRYIAAPLVLFYVRANEDLVPIAIQLRPTPGPDNPIWTPLDPPQNWMLAKLYVVNADFHWHFAISHLFRCHWLMEPFVIATMRQISSVHPVYKLLKPYFRYTLVTNTLIRRNLFQKFGPLEKYTSLGPDGFLELVQRYWTTPGCFKFSDLNPINEMQRRGIDDDTCLRRYFYRDDALRLWNAIQSCVKGILSLFYLSSDDVNNDIELKLWLQDLRENGFARRADVPADVTTVDELADLVSGIIFNLTGQHSATHFDALDLYGFIPDVPALMRQPVPDRRDHVVTRNTLSATLPDQFPDAYYVCLAFVLQVHHADQNVIQSASENYFVEPDAVRILDEFRQALGQITRTIHTRNTIMKIKYENLVPALIPTSAEPIPYIPCELIREAVNNGPKLSRDVFVKMAAAQSIAIAPVELMSLPVCLHFATTLGGRSYIGRRMVSPAFCTSKPLSSLTPVKLRQRSAREDFDEVDNRENQRTLSVRRRRESSDF